MRRRSLLLTDPRQLTWIEEEIPLSHPDQVLVRTRSGAVSVGTELPIYRGMHRGYSQITYPYMTGYESLGEVVTAGAEVQGLATGDRIVAFYGHCTHAVLPAEHVIPVPADISEAAALLTILACDTAKGVAKVNVRHEDRVLVIGAGTIGLLTVFNLTSRDIQHVDVIEPKPHRRELALQFGAGQAVAPDDAELLA